MRNHLECLFLVLLLIRYTSTIWIPFFRSKFWSIFSSCKNRRHTFLIITLLLLSISYNRRFFHKIMVVLIFIFSIINVILISKTSIKKTIKAYLDRFTLDCLTKSSTVWRIFNSFIRLKSLSVKNYTQP